MQFRFTRRLNCIHVASVLQCVSTAVDVFIIIFTGAQGAKSSPAKAPAKKETGKGKTAAGKTEAAAKGGERKAKA